MTTALIAGTLGALYYFAGNNSSSSSSNTSSSSYPSIPPSAYSPPPAPLPEPIIERPPDIPPQILGRPELRYCYREGYRIDGMRDFVDVAKDNDLVDTFNARVEDFNARCGHMRFHDDDEKAVRVEVNAQTPFWRSNWRN